MGRTGPKHETTRVTLPFKLCSLEWGAKHRRFTCCMYATYEVIQSIRDEGTERTGPKVETNRVVLTIKLSS